jgi:tetratricopeptide (TPR) repeat protein
LVICLSLIIGCSPYSLPENKTYSEKDDPYIYYAESIGAYDAKDYQVALQKIDQALILNDNLAQFFQLKGDVHRALGENDKAIETYKTAIMKRSNFVEVHESIAQIYEGQKQYDEAIRYYKRAVILDPSKIDIILQIVNGYIQWNEMDVAEHQLNFYKKSALEQKRPISERYYVLRGEVLFLTKRFEESLAVLNEVSPSDSLALYLYGKNYYALNDFSTGVTYFNKLLNEDKDNGSWYFYRGIYFFNQKDYTDAKGQFEYGFALDETLYETHYYLGKIFLEEGDEGNALEEFRLFRQQIVESEKSEEIDNLIQSLESKIK